MGRQNQGHEQGPPSGRTAPGRQTGPRPGHELRRRQHGQPVQHLLLWRHHECEDHLRLLRRQLPRCDGQAQRFLVPHHADPAAERQRLLRRGAACGAGGDGRLGAGPQDEAAGGELREAQAPWPHQPHDDRAQLLRPPEGGQQPPHEVRALGVVGRGRGHPAHPAGAGQVGEGEEGQAAAAVGRRGRGGRAGRGRGREAAVDAAGPAADGHQPGAAEGDGRRGRGRRLVQGRQAGRRKRHRH
mmetsp:Transcript_103062/g.291384  ORF Transcript_103062/g.291384 Transcript_103062/m.291384 type:complete len:242 (-) Transcript_103062:697-1422(-)